MNEEQLRTLFIEGKVEVRGQQTPTGRTVHPCQHCGSLVHTIEPEPVCKECAGH